MAISCVTRKVFSIIPLLVIILSLTSMASSFSPSDKVTKELVYQLCAKPTIYNHFCVAWLTSDPTTFTLDLHGLIGMVIEKTEGLGYKNLAMMKGLARTTTDPKLKIPYGSCVIEYELAIKAIEVAKGFASSKDYLLASKAVFKAFDSTSSCETDLEGLILTTNVVYSRNLMFERMCNIDRVFIDLLTV